MLERAANGLPPLDAPNGPPALLADDAPPNANGVADLFGCGVLNDVVLLKPDDFAGVPNGVDGVDDDEENGFDEAGF